MRRSRHGKSRWSTAVCNSFSQPVIFFHIREYIASLVLGRPEELTACDGRQPWSCRLFEVWQRRRRYKSASASAWILCSTIVFSIGYWWCAYFFILYLLILSTSVLLFYNQLYVFILYASVIFLDDYYYNGYAPWVREGIQQWS